MKILKQGAEAIIYTDEIEGQKVLVKERIRKRYRLEQIDRKLRSSRTKQEIKLISEARGYGVLTPKIISSDENSFKIIMENIEGILLKDFFKKSRNFSKVCSKIGLNIGKLHSAGIIHGDLTTSNIILKNEKIYFVDFGLGYFSKKIEDMATDLNVLREALHSSNHKISSKCWREILKGYKMENKKYEEVLSRIEEIESRARYRER